MKDLEASKIIKDEVSCEGEDVENIIDMILLEPIGDYEPLLNNGMESFEYTFEGSCLAYNGSEIKISTGDSTHDYVSYGEGDQRFSFHTNNPYYVLTDKNEVLLLSAVNQETLTTSGTFYIGVVDMIENLDTFDGLYVEIEHTNTIGASTGMPGQFIE